MVLFELFGINRDYILQFLGLNIPLFFLEILDVAIMAIAVAYIFEGMFGRSASHTESYRGADNYDPLKHYPRRKWFDFERLKLSLYAIAPSVVLHELLHKIVAVSLGVKATFFASYGGLFLGMVLKLVGSGIIFFVPGYVSIAPTIPFNSALIAFAGPFANLLLWFGSWYALKYKSHNLSSRWQNVLVISKRVNLFLFFFNMIPLPPFDGGHVLFSLIEMF